MSIFESIKNAIFSHSASSASTPSTAGAGSPAPTAPAPPPRIAQPSSARSAATSEPATPAQPAARAQPAAPPSAAPPVQQPVDVQAVLNGLAARNPEKLAWHQSIVDLMKLLGLDSSLQNRTALARELGYRGDAADSASMNLWLHRQVMAKLAQSGGKVPPSLRG